MTVFDILKFNREFISRILDAGIRPGDVRHLDIYSSYLKTLSECGKVSYAVSTAARTHGVSERFVYSLIKRLNKPLHV